MLKILLLLTTFCVLASNGRKRVSELATDDVIWTTTEQLLDNFNPIDNRTFYTRNLENGQFYERGGPIIVYIGGEWTIEEYGVKGGIAFQLAKRHKGYLFYPEHRYYGLSTPHYFKPKEEYRYHSTEQALADLANSIYQLKRRIQSLKNSQVIALGASYSGGMALWARMKYPHLLNVIYACGPVVYLPTENKSYHDISFKTYRRENETCARIIREAFDEARLLLSSDDGKRWFYGIMKNWVCVQESMVDPIPDILQSLFTTLNVQLSFHKDVPASCSNLLHNTSGTPLERLAQNLPLFMASANTKYCRNNGESL